MNVSDDIVWEMIKRCITRIDLAVLCRFLEKNEQVIELGVQAGSFSNELLTQAMPKNFTGIDVWDAKIATYWTQEAHDWAYAAASDIAKDHIENPRLKWMGIETADMVKGDHSILYADYPDEHFDFVYIDSDHEYDPTVRDIEQWWPKVKKGGVLAGHDYKHRKGLHKITGEPWQWGVVEAVNEFANRVSLDFYTTQESVGKSWVFLKPSDYEVSITQV